MKHKFTKILGVGLTLALLTSLLLTAAPVAAEETEGTGWVMATPTVTAVTPAEGEQGVTLPVVITGTGFAQGPEDISFFHADLGTADWSTAEAYGESSYSAKLFLPTGADSNSQAAVILAYDDSLASLPTVVLGGKSHEVVDVSKFYFWCNSQRSGIEVMPTLPYIVLDMDTTGDSEREYALVSRGSRLTDEPSQASEVNVWQKLSPNDGVIATGGWKCIDVIGGAPPISSEDEPLGYWQEEFPTGTVLNVKLWFGELPGARTQDEIAYVGDVTIGETVYAMEPLETASVVDFGTGISVDSYTVDSSSQITASISIDGAALGLKNVSVTLPSAGTGTGENVFNVIAAEITVTAPSAIDLGLMAKDADTSGVSDPAGSVVTTATNWIVEAIDAKVTDKGYMTKTGPTALTELFQISEDGENYFSADVGITYDQAGGTSLPFHVSQYVGDADAAGSYSITITFAATY